MAGNFNPQILVDKLAKLNMSQQSIETLSHWCIFHMNKAKQVVETWDRQFHCSPREQRVAFLYLANDILQNSRRKGVEFVTEFWKVLPGTLRDVIDNGDEFGKKAATRLVNIWEERKVFGSRGQLLKVGLQKRPPENGDNNASPSSISLKSPGGSVVDKLVTGYQSVYGNQLDEEAVLNKCRTAISFVEKVEKDFGGDYRLAGHVNSSITDELKGQRAVLRDIIQQLRTVESSRANLVALLRDALQEQESKLVQVRDQLQVAQIRSEQADHICQQLLGGSSVNGNGAPALNASQTFTSHEQQPSTVVYTRQVSTAPELSINAEKDHKMEAAEMAAKIMAATSSAQMVTFVLSTLASGGALANPVNEPSRDYQPPEKKAKVDEGHQSSLAHTDNPPAPPPEGPCPEEHPPPPPSSPPPPLPPLPQPMRPYQVPQYTHVYSVPYTYNMPQPQLVAAPGTNYGAPIAGVSQYPLPPNIYQGYPGEGGYYNHQ